MGRDIGRRTFARLGVLLGLGAIGQDPAGAAQQQANPEGEPSPIWAAMLKILPDQYRTIDVYAENPSRTKVLFRSRQETAIFSTATGAIQVITHPKPLGRINRITFETNRADRSTGFVLWLDGVPQMTVLAKP